MYEKVNKKIFLILILGFCIRIFGMMFLTLGEWDERFHVLVAKNLINSPLYPSLINDGLVNLDFHDWSMCDTWLAKPPLSLWIISLSIKLFGVNEFAIRFPSLIFSLLSIYLTFCIGRKLFSEKIGVIAAFFYAINGLLYEINIGLLSGDHVDTLFHLFVQLLFYVLLIFSKNNWIKKNIYLGLLLGCLFMVKWSMSFILLCILIVYLFVCRRTIQEYFISIFIIITSFLVFSIPWVLWIFYQFPNESKWMLKAIVAPISEVVQGHKGSWFYYLNEIRKYINELIYLPLIFLIWKSYKRLNKQRLLLILWIFIPMILLSISATKREVYIMIASTPMFILLGLFVVYLSSIKKEFIYPKFITFLVALIFIASIRYSIERIKPLNARLVMPQYRIEMKNLIYSNNLNPDSIVLVNEPHYLEARFFYNIKGYQFLDDSTVTSIKLKGYRVFRNILGKYEPL